MKLFAAQNGAGAEVDKAAAEAYKADIENRNFDRIHCDDGETNLTCSMHQAVHGTFSHARECRRTPFFVYIQLN